MCLNKQKRAERLQRRIVRRLEARSHTVSVTVLCRELGVLRPELDAALSALGLVVWWHRIGRGGDRFYGLR